MASVFDTSMEWADANFASLPGQAYDADTLTAECEKKLADFPGVSTKRWLFVYSPSSAKCFFEVDTTYARFALASAKLASVASHGGMLLGADFSDKWATPECKGTFHPLMVCKP